MTMLDRLVEKLNRAAAVIGLPPEVHGIIALVVTDENGEASLRALNVSERRVHLSALNGRRLDLAAVDLARGAISVPSRDHDLVRLLECVAKLLLASTIAGMHTDSIPFRTSSQDRSSTRVGHLRDRGHGAVGRSSRPPVELVGTIARRSSP